jgi:Leucine-rich repeat (LRR) protein
LTFLFVAFERAGGLGKTDIWMSTRATEKDPWSEPVNLGPRINTPDNEHEPCLSADGLTLLFASDRPGGKGDFDIWMSTRSATSQPWSAPVNLESVNSEFGESGPQLSADGTVLLFNSNRPGGSGDSDLWMCTRTSPSAPWSVPVNLGPKVNSPAWEGPPALSADGKTLLFASTRPGCYGKYDIWMSQRVPKQSKQPKSAAEWEKSVSTLPAEEQVQAVANRLKELNPGFDGHFKHTLDAGAVVEVFFSGAENPTTDAVANLAPLRAFTGLTRLVYFGTSNNDPWQGNGKLADLSPLAGMQLTKLHLSAMRVTDLKALKGMPLTDVQCSNCLLNDLSPLAGMSLGHLDCSATKVADLVPLKGMPLTMLSLPYTSVSDLKPLAGMKLDFLNCTGTKVTDLAPLQGMPLTKLFLTGTPVLELKPLSGMKLVLLDCANTAVTDISPLVGMPFKEVYCQGSQVKSLLPLKGAPLEILNCSLTPVNELSPLIGMKLTVLYCDDTKAPDLTPLKGMPLVQFNCRGYDLKAEVNKEVLRSLKSVTNINSLPLEAFWKELDGK